MAELTDDQRLALALQESTLDGTRLPERYEALTDDERLQLALQESTRNCGPTIRPVDGEAGSRKAQLQPGQQRSLTDDERLELALQESTRDCRPTTMPMESEAWSWVQRSLAQVMSAFVDENCIFFGGTLGAAEDEQQQQYALFRSLEHIVDEMLAELLDEVGLHEAGQRIHHVASQLAAGALPATMQPHSASEEDVARLLLRCAVDADFATFARVMQARNETLHRAARAHLSEVRGAHEVDGPRSHEARTVLLAAADAGWLGEGAPPPPPNATGPAAEPASHRPSHGAGDGEGLRPSEAEGLGNMRLLAVELQRVRAELEHATQSNEALRAEVAAVHERNYARRTASDGLEAFARDAAARATADQRREVEERLHANRAQRMRQRAALEERRRSLHSASSADAANATSFDEA